MQLESYIDLNNYLLDLVSEKDNKMSSVYIINGENYIKEVWSEMVVLNKRSLYVRKLIPAKLGIHANAFYPIKNGKKNISIQLFYKLLILWKELCGKNKQEFTKKWNQIFESNLRLSSRRNLPVILPRQINADLSYFAGWICGDGNLANYNDHYLVKISEKSLDQLELVLRPLFQSLFGVEPKVYRMYEKGYAIQINSKPIFRFLTRVLKLRVGYIPEFIYELDKANRASFLAGVFDSEGYVSKDRNRLTISQAKKDFLLDLVNISNGLGVKFNGPTQHVTKLGTWYSIRLESKNEILKFSKIIGSRHVDKSKVLNDMILRINNSHGYT